jgi:hypothetical protein
MSNCRDETDPLDGSALPQPPRADRLHPGFVQLEDYPELIPVLTRAVDEVIDISDVNRERDAAVVEDVERAAAAAALATYQRMAVAAVQAGDTADEARRSQAQLVATTAGVIAERVTDAASEVHTVDVASADHLALVSTNAASELAAGVGLDDETAASTAAALVVKAVSEAAAVNASARAVAASSVAKAAADAAAEVAEEAASAALATQSEVITDASERQQVALATCYEVAVATAQAMLIHQPGVELLQPHGHPADIQRKPA